MAYTVNRYDATLLVSLADETLDTGNSSLSLIGRNYDGFGEVLNENFVHLLEHFRDTSSPSNPLEGQLWYDSGNDLMKAYDGANWIELYPNGVDRTIFDSNANELVTFQATASAVNFIDITNAATNNGPEIKPLGTDTHIDLELHTKGNGHVRVIPNGTGGLKFGGQGKLFSNSTGTGSWVVYDGSSNEIFTLDAPASSVNYLTFSSNTTTNAPTISATGDDTNVDLVLFGKGTGVVKATDTANEIRDAHRANTADVVLTTTGVWDAMAEVALTDAASVTWDMSTGIDFSLTTTAGVGATRALANPTNTTVGKKGRIRVVQDGSGSRALTFGTNFEFAGGTAVTLTTTASAEDILFYDVISSTRILITAVLDIS